MQCTHHPSIHTFAEKAERLLLQHEAENCFMLGVIHRLTHQSTTQDPSYLMFTIESVGQTIAAALQTDPIGMFVSRFPSAEAIDCIANVLRDTKWSGRGFIGSVETADGLARRWSEIGDQPMKVFRDLRVFELTRVIWPQAVSGRLVEAPAEELDLITKWVDAFCCEIDEPTAEPARMAKRLIDEKRLYLWKDESFRAMTGITGPTPNGIRINFVYTPPDDRGRGYASNLVAAVSQRMLDNGRTRCFLNTDLSNPTSNKIYQQIGYRAVCDFRHWVFADLSTCK